MRGYVGSVGVAIPSIPLRGTMLGRALTSVTLQTHVPDRISVAIDVEGHGATATRNAAWESLSMEWVAFLDDDDEFLPHHLETLLRVAEVQDADMVHSWFEVIGGADPFPENRGRTFDVEHPHQTTITCLWRRSLLCLLGGFRRPTGGQDEQGHVAGEDHDIVIRAAREGARIVAVPDITWRWHHHGANTMGLPSRWRRD